ncbi:hypothetical protein PV328_012418 [Microctonus aethiopoides]|uniref:Uncharacterized protein n=1 Tax=Microctonus aethiopoides TaxID=144406 RepID=A0AA39FE28_9HYME|nr:hypothetical protein PV328_012418 [Microctonus aethiopoides]
MDTPDTLLTKEQRMSIHEDYMFQKHFHGEQLNTELECNHDISDLYNNAMWCKHPLTNQMKYDCGVDTSCSKCEYIHDCFEPLMGLYSMMRSCKIKQYAEVCAGNGLIDSNSILTSTGPDLILSFCLEQSITMSGVCVAYLVFVTIGSVSFP